MLNWMPLRLLLAVLMVSVLGTEGCKNKEEKVVYRDRPTIPDPLPPGAEPDVPEPPPRPGFVDNDVFEADFLTQVVDTGEFDRPETRAIDACDTLNEGKDLAKTVAAIDLALNSISKEAELVRTIGVGEGGCIRVFDKRDFGLSQTDWLAIEAADPWDIISETARGLLLIQLTQTLKPWLHAANFLEIVNRNELYYDLLQIPDNLNDFENDFLGCNFQLDFDQADKDLALWGITDSQIALQKPRLFQRADCREGFVYKTFDRDLGSADVVIAGINLANLFEAPFPLEANEGRTFAHDASEYIALAQNGTLIFTLYEANGQRANAAPQTTVQDGRAASVRLPGEIQNSRACYGCHSNGPIPAQDEVLTRILENNDFNNREREKAEAYFSPVKEVFFAQDQQEYCSNIAEIGISCADSDPVNWRVDDYRLEWDIAQLAAWYRLRPEDMASCISSSSNGSERIGQILSGSTVRFQDILLAHPFLLEDCSLFQDKFGG